MIIEFNGKTPKIHPTAFIASTAVLIGDIEIGEGSGVWFGAVIRADIDKVVVGKFSNIQDNSVVHVDFGKPAIIGDFVTVGHSAVIHGAVVGDGSLVGMGATILDGATVGERAIIGANSLVLSGKTIEPESLAAGVPAKTLRKLTEKEIESVRNNAKLYSELAQEFAK